MVLKFCANISFMFAESGNLLERYQLAKKAGFRGVECAFPAGFTFDEVVAAKREANIAQVLMNTCNGMCLDIATFISDYEAPMTATIVYYLKLLSNYPSGQQKMSWEESSGVQPCLERRMNLRGTFRRHSSWPQL